MPDTRAMVINTGPLIALVAATGSLDILQRLKSRIVVPFEVGHEILAGGQSGFAVAEYTAASFLEKLSHPTQTGLFLSNILDLGEASVIQTALDLGISTVCIDEVAGRRIARLNGLSLTGSLGIILKIKQQDPSISVRTMLDAMHRHGIWVGKNLAESTIKIAGE